MWGGMEAYDNQGLSVRELLSIRNKHVASACRVHFTESPLKIVRAKGQYMYDERNEKYLDCTSRTSAVGHCHPEIVSAATTQISTLNVPFEEPYSEEYAKTLLATLPSKFQTCLFTNSGGEANDIALQLARRYTKKTDVAVVEGSFHGAVLTLTNVAVRAFRVSSGMQNPWVHVVPCPILGGNADDNAEEAIRVMEEAKRNQKQIGCFISEPILIVPGVVVPPRDWLKSIYSYVQSNGGLVICDEIVSGFGRAGSFWAFDAVGHGAVPDIVTIGKHMGNGYPLAGVLTSEAIASFLTPAERLRFRCGPVESAIGLTVLKVLREEQLLSNVSRTGNYFRRRLEALRGRHKNIGQVRGIGLVIGVDIIHRNGTASSVLADQISYRLKEKGVLVGAEGYDNNTLSFIPPLCISTNDVDYILKVLEKILLEIAIDQDVSSFLERLESGVVESSEWVNSSEDSLNNNVDYIGLD